ncbi:YafY family protein [Paraferrimonas sp. SM1919]|uniref:helix-turn-helix transcriptional regulator n=1 Tax=Paraferrimonas sp. SM1919 TaxID=2662263 RepID=UPI0013D30932|nr:WYL domain-containing protein [Paraferrimonas sp. SM1919]
MQANIQRQVAMLEHIPRHPKKVTANFLHDKLKERGFKVGLRTVQRELKGIYELGLFGLVIDDRCKPFGWSIAACWRGLNLTLMDQHMALAFHTLKHSAKQLLPPASIKQLTPYFERADQVLANDPDNPWLYWACRVAQLPEPFPLIYDKPDNDHFETVQDAILEKRQLACKIQRIIKGKPYWLEYNPINPEGIKISNGVAFLAFTVGNSNSKRYLQSMDQLRDIRLLDTAIIERDDFDIAKAGSEPRSPIIKVELNVHPSANFLLRNAKLSEDQTAELQTCGRYKVTATVQDSTKFRAFLWENAPTVEVLAPTKLRDYFFKLSQKVSQQYQTIAT